MWSMPALNQNAANDVLYGRKKHGRKYCWLEKSQLELNLRRYFWLSTEVAQIQFLEAVLEVWGRDQRNINYESTANDILCVRKKHGSIDGGRRARASSSKIWGGIFGCRRKLRGINFWRPAKEGYFLYQDNKLITSPASNKLKHQHSNAKIPQMKSYPLWG